MEVLSKVATTIQAHELLVPGQGIVLGVSGGADSLCALDCLQHLGYKVVVAHLDHQLRRGAWREAERVLAIARDYQLPAVVERQDVRAFAGHGRSLEEAARIVRYAFLARVAHERKLEVIATGHTADDQVETILMHLLRGAGPTGLAGMRPSTELEGWVDLGDSQGLRLVRPLLETTRQATELYCRQNGLQPIADPSNRSPAFFRNRIRMELVPMLESYNPSIREVVLRMGEVMRAEADFLAAATEDAWSRTVREAGPHSLAIDRARFTGLPRAVQRSTMREAVARLWPSVRDFGFDHIEQAVEFIVRPGSGKPESLPGSLEILPAGDEVIVRQEGSSVALPMYPQLTSTRQRRLHVPGKLKLASGWTIQSEHVRLTAELRRQVEGSNQHAIVLDQYIADDLKIRPATPGDRLRPFGMVGTSKISDIMINSHIPQIARARWPIVFARGIPIWVIGLRAAEETRLATTKGDVVNIRVLGPEGEGR